MAVEEPTYTVVVDAPPFQIRAYPRLLSANVEVDGDRSEAVSAGFRILAGYIFGSNSRREKIAMTAPVLQTPARAGTPSGTPSGTLMGAPAGGAGKWQVSFILPAGMSKDSLPAPTDVRIKFTEVRARTVAVVRFSGFWTESNLDSHAAELAQFLMDRGMSPAAAPLYAFYDPPWKPWFLRRNEILVVLPAS